LSDEYYVRWFREEDTESFVEGLNVDLWDEYSKSSNGSSLRARSTSASHPSLW